MKLVTRNKCRHTQQKSEALSPEQHTAHFESRWIDSDGKPTELAIEFFRLIQNEIERSNTKKSLLAAGYKAALRVLLILFITALLVFVVIAIYSAHTSQDWLSLWQIVPVLMIASVCIMFIKEINTISKTDAYNVVMMLLAILTIVFSIITK